MPTFWHFRQSCWYVNSNLFLFWQIYLDVLAYIFALSEQYASAMLGFSDHARYASVTRFSSLFLLWLGGLPVNRPRQC